MCACVGRGARCWRRIEISGRPETRFLLSGTRFVVEMPPSLNKPFDQMRGSSGKLFKLSVGYDSILFSKLIFFILMGGWNTFSKDDRWLRSKKRA